MVRSGAKGMTRASAEALKTDAVITAVRPYFSLSALTGSRASASAAVVAETVRLAWAGLRDRPVESAGSRACVE